MSEREAASDARNGKHTHLVNDVPLLNANLLRSRTNVCCDELLQITYCVVLAAEWERSGEGVW